jgi:hypothetical protein
MATTRRSNAKKQAAPLFANGTPSELVATAILSGHSDLMPSVMRIMGAGLGEEGQLHAITLFQQSLGVAGDPMRKPANAIEAGRAQTGQEPDPD